MTDAPANRLEHFPITFFAVVMGLMGLSLAFHAAEWHRSSGAVLIGAVGVFALIALTYLAKALRYPAAVRAEWLHPVRLAFFPTITISLLLTAAGLREGLPDLARAVWWAGMLGQGALTLAVVSGWISHRSFQVGHLTPAWFIPAVGNVIVPIAGVGLGHPEISWLFFAAGMVFWVVLLTLVFNRLVFHDPIPARLFPTMVILIAPPAVGFVAWTQLAGGLDAFGRFLLYAAYVFAALVLVQAPRIARLPFALSFWALSFPVAALSIASFRFAALAGSEPHRIIGLASLVAVSLIVAGLVIRTLIAMSRGEICRPE